MSEIEILIEACNKIKLPITIRTDDKYSYLFFGEPKDAECLTGLGDNFETTALHLLLLRHSFFEFENGKLVTWSPS